jgi:hypothetical protein
MVPDRPQESSAMNCSPFTPEERNVQRRQLAELIGRLLAHYWLRTRGHVDTPTVSEHTPKETRH